MKTNTRQFSALSLAAAAMIILLNAQTSTAAPLGTAFTYQGRLADGGTPANGSYDLTFTLYDDASGSNVVAGPLTNSPVGVTNGLFTVPLDFGADVFNGTSHWLEIGVRTNGSADDFTLLSPRQPLTPAPYALYAPSAGTAATAGSANSVAAANITGTMALAQLPGSVLTNGAIGVTLAGTFSGDGSGLTALNAANVTGTLGTAQIPNLDAAKITTGTLADARLSPNVALLSNSQTFSGAKTFSANVTATGSLRLNGLLRSGSETGAAYPSYPSNPDGSTGLVIRRISSTTTSSNSVVARTDRLTLVRDGTVSGLNIVFAAGAGISTINATGIDRAGNVVTRVLSTMSPPPWTVVFSDAQKVVHYDISFGNTFLNGHTCHVILDRYDDGINSDYFLIGTVTTTYNQ